MYDVIVVGQGLTGLLSAIWATENNKRVALISSGSGKILQSTGCMERYVDTDVSNINEAVGKFKTLVQSLGVDYEGTVDFPVALLTGTGYVKKTNLYPSTMVPLPRAGQLVIVGFSELADFKPMYMKANLQDYHSELQVDTVSISIGQKTTRTLTSLDIARLLDKDTVRREIIETIKMEIHRRKLKTPDLFVFPSCLGMNHWKIVKQELEESLGAKVSEAAGMPPNAAAVRLFEALRKEAIKRGVRFFSDTTVTGATIQNGKALSLLIQNYSNQQVIQGERFIIATGGVLGGGLTVMSGRIEDTIFAHEVNEAGNWMIELTNVYPVGAQKGPKLTKYGITGGLYSILSSYQAVFSSASIKERRDLYV